MSRRGVVLVLSLALGTTAAIAAWRLRTVGPSTTTGETPAQIKPPGPSMITSANIAKIKRGMTPQEVDAILGGTPRDEAGDAYWSFFRTARGMAWADAKKWVGPQDAVLVLFMDRGRVSSFSVGRTLPRYPDRPRD